MRSGDGHTANARESIALARTRILYGVKEQRDFPVRATFCREGQGAIARTIRWWRFWSRGRFKTRLCAVSPGPVPLPIDQSLIRFPFSIPVSLVAAAAPRRAQVCSRLDYARAFGGSHAV